ncbi:MAG: SAF domain-containing protein [Bifidobacteriaceae bacterium]|jgi:Flp pilus assembly protein CpaB|nr:SAF domain-containing protein [Bifidobacteriaceae bacterium]
MINSQRRRTVQALAWRLRWAGIAVLAAILIRLALPGVVAAFSGGSPVLVLARDLPVGAQITPEDVKVVLAPPGIIPDGALTNEDAAIGEFTRTALPRLTMVHQGLLEAVSDRQQPPPGLVSAAVRLSDPGMVAVVRPGDRLDIMASAGSSASGSIAPAQVLAHSALVLTAPGTDQTEESGSGLSVPAASAGLLLVAVTPAEAEMIGGAGSWAVISAVLVGQ